MKRILYISMLAYMLSPVVAYGQGLRFSGGEQPIDKRTSYSVFGESRPAFSGYMDIEFDLSLYQETQIGYIIRIKSPRNSPIYNLFYDGQGGDLLFMFNEEGRSSIITARVDKNELLNRDWFRMKVELDLRADSVKLTVGDRTFAAKHEGLPDTYYPVVVFGRSDHIIDVPSFAIKNLSVGNDSERYFFELRENEGNAVHDRRGRDVGEVLNPEWLINDAYHWRFMASFKSETVAGANYDPDRKEIYYFNRDCIYIYNVRSGETDIHAFGEKCPVDLALGTNFIDSAHNKLYAYEVYYNERYNGPMVAALDLDTYSWSAESYDKLPTQRHHHSSYFDPGTGFYTIFGGFGHMLFNNDFNVFDYDTKSWKTLDGLEGDVIFPRYFSSAGYLKETNSVYIFGGMGNESGEQVVGRQYYYDLHRVDLTTGRITKLWQIPWQGNNVVPVRGMVIPDENAFYTLCYPEHFSDSFLRLYRFSIRDGSYQILGDSIPIHSDRITTNANIYYDSQLNTLYALVQEFDDDIVSDLKVYSLAYPPITAEELAQYRKPKNSALWIALLSVCVCAAGAACFVFIVLKRRKKPAERTTAGERGPDGKTWKSRPNSAYLFGDFAVFDRNDKDITYMFSARLRQTFCVILQYSAGNGISSQRLSNLLWPDRPEDKVKNSRGVTINHLRKVLSELDGVELVYDRGHFKIVQEAGFYCDYARCLEIISGGRAGDRREELLEILARGKFLKFSDQPMFDSFKKEVELKLEPVLLLEMEKSFDAEEYRTTVAFAEALFDIDPFCDEALAFRTRALRRMKMNDEAKILYQAFAIEYAKTMGKDYPHPFKDMN